MTTNTTPIWRRDEKAEVRVDRIEQTAYDPDLYRPSATRPPDRQTMADVDEAAVATYREAGMLSIAAAFSPERRDDAVAGIDRLISGDVEGFRGIQWESRVRDRLDGSTREQRRMWVRKLVYYVDAEPRLHALAHDPDLLRVVGNLLGGEPTLFADQALLKPAGIGREKPWHQDKAFFDVRSGAPVVGVWIALDRADVGNGCMHVIPGTHRAGPVLHFNRRDFQICDTDVERTRVEAIELDPGGLMIFDGLLQHGTPTNESDRQRWALQFHFARAEDIWRTKEERAAYKEKRLEAFGADGTDATC